MIRAAFIAIASTIVLGALAWTAYSREVEETSLRGLYERGATYQEFVASAEFARSDTGLRRAWRDNYSRAAASADSAALAVSRLPGTWRLLVVAEPWCSDGANSLPFLAAIAEKAPNVELRIVSRERGKGVLAAHRLDGREAIPTVIVLDEAYEERGAWIEEPAALRDLLRANRALPKDSLRALVRDWRAKDGGRTVSAEFAALIDRASTPTPCSIAE
jgi:hypothetical protein